MPTIQELGSIGEFVGSIAVLLTLIYLAMQIRQNTQALEETQRNAKVEAMQRRNERMEASFISGALSAEMTELNLRARKEGLDSITEIERSRVFQWEMARVLRLEAQYFQWENGYLDDDYFEHQFLQVVQLNGVLWRELDINYGRPSFQSAVNHILDGGDT